MKLRDRISEKDLKKKTVDELENIIFDLSDKEYGENQISICYQRRGKHYWTLEVGETGFWTDGSCKEEILIDLYNNLVEDLCQEEIEEILAEQERAERKCRDKVYQDKQLYITA